MTNIYPHSKPIPSAQLMVKQLIHKMYTQQNTKNNNKLNKVKIKTHPKKNNNQSVGGSIPTSPTTTQIQNYQNTKSRRRIQLSAGSCFFKQTKENIATKGLHSIKVNFKNHFNVCKSAKPSPRNQNIKGVAKPLKKYRSNNQLKKFRNNSSSSANQESLIDLRGVKIYGVKTRNAKSTHSLAQPAPNTFGTIEELERSLNKSQSNSILQNHEDEFKDILDIYSSVGSERHEDPQFSEFLPKFSTKLNSYNSNCISPKNIFNKLALHSKTESESILSSLNQKKGNEIVTLETCRFEIQSPRKQKKNEEEKFLLIESCLPEYEPFSLSEKKEKSPANLNRYYFLSLRSHMENKYSSSKTKSLVSTRSLNSISKKSYAFKKKKIMDEENKSTSNYYSSLSEKIQFKQSHESSNILMGTFNEMGEFIFSLSKSFLFPKYNLLEKISQEGKIQSYQAARQKSFSNINMKLISL